MPTVGRKQINSQPYGGSLSNESRHPEQGLVGIFLGPEHLGYITRLRSMGNLKASRSTPQGAFVNRLKFEPSIAALAPTKATQISNVSQISVVVPGCIRRELLSQQGVCTVAHDWTTLVHPDSQLEHAGARSSSISPGRARIPGDKYSVRYCVFDSYGRIWQSAKCG
jgi:hypothetical protein